MPARIYTTTKKSKSQKKQSIKVRKLKTFFRTNTSYLLGIIVVALFLVAVYIVYRFFFLTDRYRINDIQILGAENFSNPQDLHKLTSEQVSGENLILFDPERLMPTILNNYQSIKSVTFSKDYPSTLNITVQERDPIAILKTNDGSYLVDREGYILGYVSGDFHDLPEILFASELHVGQTIRASLVPLYVSLLSELDKKEYDASSISVDIRGVSFYLEDVFITLGSDKRIGSSIALLDDLLLQFSLEGKSAKKIDLRYDKVIVEFEEANP